MPWCTQSANDPLWTWHHAPSGGCNCKDRTLITPTRWMRWRRIKNVRSWMFDRFWSRGGNGKRRQEPSTRVAFYTSSLPRRLKSEICPNSHFRLAATHAQATSEPAWSFSSPNQSEKSCWVRRPFYIFWYPAIPTSYTTAWILIFERLHVTQVDNVIYILVVRSFYIVKTLLALGKLESLRKSILLYYFTIWEVDLSIFLLQSCFT